MDGRENRKAMHLLMLSCYSLFTVILIAETVVLKWEIAAVPPMLFGMAVCWTLYIIRSDFVTSQMLLCFALVMLEKYNTTKPITEEHPPPINALFRGMDDFMVSAKDTLTENSK